MFDVPSLRYRYTQFFVLFTLGSFIFVMVKSTASGMSNIPVNFYQRFTLMEKVAQLRIDLGDRVFPVAVLGKDGWMEYTGEGNIDDYQHLRTFDNMNDFGRGLTTLNQYLKSQGITLLFVVFCSFQQFGKP